MSSCSQFFQKATHAADRLVDKAIHQTQQPSEGFARSGASQESTTASMLVDWLETDDAHVFHADLPGLAKEDIKVTIEDAKTLQITADTKQRESLKTDTWHLAERTQGPHTRKLRIPDDVVTDAAKTKLENGLLTITFPKIVKPETQAVQMEAVKAQVENGILTITFGNDNLISEAPSPPKPNHEVKTVRVF